MGLIYLTDVGKHMMSIFFFFYISRRKGGGEGWEVATLALQTYVLGVAIMMKIYQLFSLLPLDQNRVVAEAHVLEFGKKFRDRGHIIQRVVAVEDPIFVSLQCINFLRHFFGANAEGHFYNIPE